MSETTLGASEQSEDPAPNLPSGLIEATAPTPEVTKNKWIDRLFPVLYIASFLMVIVLAITVNFLGNGTNLLPSPGFPSDCDRAFKARRLEFLAHSTLPPRAIVLGSSRVTCFEPEYIEKLTGLRCFNSGVSVGCPVDYLTQFRFLLDLGIKPQLLIIGVDELAFGDHPENDFYDLQLITHQGLFRNAPFAERLSILARAFKTVTLQSTRRSLANLKNKPPGLRPESRDISKHYFADGLSKFFRDQSGESKHGENLAKGVIEKAKFWSAHLDQPSKVERMRPQPRMVRYFRQLLTLAREHHVEVYVALLPVHPDYEQRVFTPRLYGDQARTERSAPRYLQSIWG